MKTLAILVEHEGPLDRRSPLYRNLAKALLSRSEDFDIVPVGTSMSRDSLEQWCVDVRDQYKYVITIPEGSSISNNFVVAMLTYLQSRTVYLAEPLSYLGAIPPVVSATEVGDNYWRRRSLDIGGVAFHVERLLDLLAAFPGIDRSTIYLNYRSYWGIGKLVPQETGFSSMSQVHIANGIEVDPRADQLFGGISSGSRELRIYVLRYIILYLRGLRRTRATATPMSAVADAYRDFKLDELTQTLQTRDRFELLWLKWITGSEKGAQLYKQLDGADAFLEFGTEPPANTNVLHYTIQFGDAAVWISRAYRDNSSGDQGKDPEIYDFYSRTIGPRSIFLFFDRPAQADDNAEYLYEYFIETRPGFENAYFALSKKSADWDRLEAKGFRLVDMYSPEFYRLFVLSDLVVSSQLFDLERHGKNLSNSRYVYLQHGVQLNDMSDWVISKLFDLFIVTGEPEAEYMRKLVPRETLNSGIPRLQTLARKSNGVSGDLLFMPTWRFGLNSVSRSLFEESSYFKSINAVLTDRALDDYLERSDRKLRVKLHPNLHKRLESFTFSKNVVLALESYRECIEQADFVFTDYSSVVVDAAFVGVPIAYYQWDADEFFLEQPYERRLDYESEGLGPVFASHGQLVSHIVGEQFSNSEGRYEERRKWFFAGVEPERICERIVERMLGR